MNAVEIKQERIEYCANHLSIRNDRYGTYAVVSSATDRDNTSYRVDIDMTGDEPKANRCTCPASVVECVHYEGVNLYYENQKQSSEPARCGGCGCDLSTSKNCTANFCLWNSFYTEGLRMEEDRRLKQTAQAQQEEVVEPVVETEKSIYTHCQGCGGNYKKGDCTPVFCKWNSFYTENLRRQMDEYDKQLLPGFLNGSKSTRRRQRHITANRFTSVA